MISNPSLSNPGQAPETLTLGSGHAPGELALIANALERTTMMHRMGLNGTTHGGKRDLYNVFGYPASLDSRDYAFKYSRQDIAGRIAQAYPEATWSSPPEVLDDEESQDETEFEKAFKELAKKLKLWHYLARVDTLAQLGRYSVLVIGFTGGSDVAEQRPATAKVAYLMPYGETSAQIQQLENDPKNERFGKPLKYQVNLIDVSLGTVAPTTVQTTSAGRTLVVHHSRAIHVAEGLLDNEVYGMPILQNIYNRLEDLEKVAGGGSEIYWINGRGGLNLNIDKDAKVPNLDKIKEDAEDYINQLSRILRTQGMDVKPIILPFESPKDLVEILLQLISGATGIPKRILTGSEAGELASSQDEDNWLSRVDERRKNHAEPMLLRPLIDLFIATGDLPKPKDDKYEIKWPDLVNLSDEKKADIAVKKAGAMATYVNAMGADQLIPPQQFVEEVLHMEYREDEIADIAAEEARQEEEERTLLAEEGDVGHEREKELVKLKQGPGTLPAKRPAGKAPLARAKA